MARYIDADFVANGLHEVLHRPKSDFPDDYEKAIDCLVYAISILKFAPTVDVKPVVHAHWDMTNTKANHNEPPFCSNCGKVGLFSRYCPNCGAVMDEQPRQT